MGRYWYGEPVKALAKRWGVTPNQMTKGLSRLRKDLKLILEREGFSL